MKKTLITYKNKLGKTKKVSPKRYVDLAQRSTVGYSCRHGHFECAAGPNGPCHHEIMADHNMEIGD